MAESMAPSQGAALDIAAAATDVSELSSYQLDITINASGVEQTMTILATKDPVAATQYTMSGDQAFSLISIEGQGAWIEQGGVWVALTGGVGPYETLFDALAPDTLISSYSLGLYGTAIQSKGSEDHNGVSTTHYHLDASTAAQLGAAGFPDDGTYDVWIANDGGYLVGAAFGGTDPDTGERTDIQMEVTRVNDASISIQPPI